MTNSFEAKHLKNWLPANYRIEVEGRLDSSWSDRLAGMRITTQKRSDQSMVTTLVGRLQDQSELTGVLNALYGLHLPILKVEIVNDD